MPKYGKLAFLISGLYATCEAVYRVGHVSMFGEINHCHLSFDVIIRPKYGSDTLTKKPMHTQVNSRRFEKKRKSIALFRSKVVW